MSHLVVLCTCPDADTARGLADSLVAQRLAACVNILPAVSSVYMWKGQVEHEDEVLLLIKTGESHYSQLQAHILEHHPYELPEVIAVPVTQGLPGYLQWLDDVMESE